MIKFYTSLVLMLLLFGTSYSQTTAIPDASFEQALIDLGIDSDGIVNGSVETYDILEVGSLDVQNKNITDLTGIEDFIGLQLLYCGRNQLTSLDISLNTNLVIFYCESNQLTNIDVSQNTALTDFFCNDNQLTSLDISNNDNLSWLICNDNQLESLNIKNGNNVNLSYMIATNNPILSCVLVDNVNAANSAELPYVNWDVDGFTFYSETECSEIMIPDPNFEQALMDLGLDTDGVINGKVNPDDVIDLKILDVQNKNITDLTGIAYFLSLETLNCSNNQIVKLNLDKNNSLQSLNCSNNILTEIILPTDGDLVVSGPGDNLYPSEKVDLMYLDCTNNQLTVLNANKNFELKEIYCDYNNLNSINLTTYNDSWGQSLEILSCSNNKLKSLNLMWIRHNLSEVNCSYNELTSLILHKDSAYYSWPLGYNIFIPGGPRILNCSFNQLTEFSLKETNGVSELNCDNNNITIFEVPTPSQYYTSATTSLELSCNNNNISSLDFGRDFIVLRELYCTNNQLESLNVKNGYNALLTTFNSQDNPNLQCIDVDNETDAINGIASYSTWVKDAIAVYSESCQSILGIGDELLLQSISFYPNPVVNVLSIDSGIPLTKVEIYSVLGRKLIEVSSDFNSIPTNNLTNGFYLVRMYSSDGTVAKKLIKK